MLQLIVTFKNNDSYIFEVSKQINAKNFIAMLADKRNWILTDEEGKVFVINVDEILFAELSFIDIGDEADEEDNEDIGGE